MFPTNYYRVYPVVDDKSVVINTLSGAIDMCGPDVVDFLTRKSPAPPAEFADVLKQRLYAHTNADDEFELVTGSFRDREPSIALFVICPTFGCNLQCSYCYERKAKVNGQLSMDTDMLKACLKHMTSLRRGFSDKPRIQLFGGEPLLPGVRRLVEIIFNYATCEGLPVQVVTNGTTLEEFKTMLHDYALHFEHVQVTVDGIADVHDRYRSSMDGTGTYTAIMRGVDWLVENGIPVHLRVNVSPATLDMLSSFLDSSPIQAWSTLDHFTLQIAPVVVRPDVSHGDSLLIAKELIQRMDWQTYKLEGVARVGLFEFFRSISCALEAAVNPNEVPEPVAHRPRQYYCQASSNTAMVYGSDGLTYCCNEVVGQSEFATGRYYPKQETYKENPWKVRSTLNIDACIGCPIMPICGGGCPLNALMTQATVMAPSCESRIGIFDLYVRSRLRRIGAS